MIFTKNGEKKPAVVLLSVLFVLNIIISVNISLSDELMYTFGFLILGITVSSLLVTLSNPIVVLTSFALGVTASLFFVPSPLSAILALSPLPFAFSLREVLRSKIGRSGAVGLSSAIVTLSLCAYFAFFTFNAEGAISPSAIINSFPIFFDKLTEIICSSSMIEVAGDSVPSITPEGAHKYLVALVGIIPGVLFALIAVCGYISALLYKKAIKLVTGLSLSTQSWKLKIELPTAILFILSLIVSLLADSVTAFSLAALNLCIVLFPALFMTGLGSAFEPKIVNGYKLPRLLRPAILFILLLVNVIYFSLLCTFFALYDCIKSVIPKRKTEEE